MADELRITEAWALLDDEEGGYSYMARSPSGKWCEVANAKKVIAQYDDRQRNLAIMVRRLSHRLSVYTSNTGDKKLVDQATGLLAKYGLTGSPLQEVGDV